MLTDMSILSTLFQQIFIQQPGGQLIQQAGGQLVLPQAGGQILAPQNMQQLLGQIIQTPDGQTVFCQQQMPALSQVCRKSLGFVIKELTANICC